jgi:2,4-diaminopentanoate dehydrogenase
MNLPGGVLPPPEEDAAPTAVFHVGLGAMGLAAARAFARRPDFRVVGAASHQAGEQLAQIVGGDADGTIAGELPAAPPAADLCVIATASTLAEVEPAIRWALEHEMNVISCAEELTFPAAADPAIGASIDAAARAAERSVLGTGINPGYAMDVLPICLTAPCLSVRGVRLRRVNDLSPYGPTVLRSFGIGASPPEFDERVASGEVVGHHGFPQSIAMMARAFGWAIDEVRQEVSPIVAGATRRGADVLVGPGAVAGCLHVAEAFSEGRVVIRMEHPQEVDPGAEGTSTGDFIEIDGEPSINVRIEPEIAGGTGTAALVVNMARRVVEAPPGLLTMDGVGLPAIAPAAAAKAEEAAAR